MTNYLTLLLIVLKGLSVARAIRQFEIDYENNQFLKDGEPFRYISGSIHYYRVPEDYWMDRLSKMKAAGLNAIQTYIHWNNHEYLPGKYNFSGQANITRFLQVCQELDLFVLLRIGPYTCSEWENGGFPWWLLKTPMRVRSSDPQFLAPVKRWYSVLLPLLRPALYNNGGPVIMVQIENEYGSFSACDKQYLGWLRDEVRSYFNNETVLYTTDGGATGYLKCGVIDGVYPTVDFGPTDQKGVADSFQAQRDYAPKGPLVNSEFYPGWLDLWGSNWTTVDTNDIVQSMGFMYAMNASFNFYVFHGGTSFGYGSGAMGSDPYYSVTTSYDYNAPLSEAGDPTPKMFAIRQQIETLTRNKIPFPVPPATTKNAYGLVGLQNLGSVIDLLNILSPPNLRNTSTYPLSSEQLNFPYGFTMYVTKIRFSGKNLSIPGLHDRAYVMLDGELIGLLERDRLINLTYPMMSQQQLQILVENQGRKTSGLNDTKGIISNITLDGKNLTGWIMYPFVFDDFFPFGPRQDYLQLLQIVPNKTVSNIHKRSKWISKLNYKKFRSGRKFISENSSFVPSIFYGTFPAPVIEDTFFDPTGWNKGQLFINGYNIGRYWPALGPQVTLFVPKSFLGPVNTVVLLELEGPGFCDPTSQLCYVNFSTQHKLNKTVTSGYLPGSKPLTTRFHSKSKLH